MVRQIKGLPGKMLKSKDSQKSTGSAHNLKVAGSNPAPATNEPDSQIKGLLREAFLRIHFICNENPRQIAMGLDRDPNLGVQSRADDHAAKEFSRQTALGRHYVDFVIDRIGRR